MENNVEFAGLRLCPEFAREEGRNSRMILKITANFFRVSDVLPMKWLYPSISY